MEQSNIIEFAEEEASCWAEIILPLALPTVYTYALPNNLIEIATPGKRVEVIFGKNKKYAGIIKKLQHTKPAYSTKTILNILDDEPLLYQEQLNFWNWLSKYYMCSEGEIMIAALPTNFKLSSETILIYNEEIGEDFTNFSDDEFIVSEALLIKKQLSFTEVQKLLDATHVYPVIKKLIDKNVCFIWEELNEKYKAKLENYVLLHKDYENQKLLEQLINDWKGAPKQMELLLAFIHFYKTEGEVIQSKLLQKSSANSAQLKSLVDKNILQIDRRRVGRVLSISKFVDVSFTLSAAQEQALSEIKNIFTQQPVCLLHGVTGSGKTELYIKLIEECFSEGKQTLYLLPEIALTTQIIRRLQKHFGGNITIYHSKFNNQERIELWHKVRSGDVKIVLGVRSSLFLPFNNLGLIIVDEEHDSSYKQQDPAPRYNARDASIYYASLFKANVLLGTATPSLESYYNAANKKYGLVTLKERYGNIQLPKIEIVNNAEVVSKTKVMISPQLNEAIKKTLDSNSQVILFQNRRGYNPYIICGNCGYIPQCLHCDVSLTLHKYSNKMHCHYCGSIYPNLITCIACGSQNWLEKNFGTEKIEEQLQEVFDKYKIARLDVDSIRGKTAHDVLIDQFEKQKIDLLVGTQMVVKGLDFDNVKLVGVLDADGLLSFTDFRVNERAFQLMEQVSGRAGRKHEQGNVLIQALNVNHPVLAMVKDHDYESFYKYEIDNRKTFFYPPFSRMVIVIVKHKDKNIVSNAANKLAQLFRQNLDKYVVGPAAPVIGRIRNKYIMEIMIKLPKMADIGISYKKLLETNIQLLNSEKQYKAVQVIIDVDPM